MDFASESNILTDRKAPLAGVGFAVSVVALALIFQVFGFFELGAITIAWGLFMTVVIALFALVPYYAIDLMGGRRR